ncbi:MAG: tRNA pseudouridine(55) synthase TruB [Clostridia bacterium]|nr:tRNA pseudouridine(55) synthase TruB [Clostridia bacterium]
MPIDGVLNFCKPRGMTSQTAVNIVKRLLGAEKAGHCGTLDPQACGVLPVMLGKAVKLSEYLTDHDKSYKAFLALGFSTDTGDLTGKVTAKCENIPSFEEISAAAKSFEGGYDQTPPMYSALKVNGQKLVNAARRGVEIARAPRRINIESIRVTREEEGIALYVACSRGTYIRTLCEDIASKAGSLGCMASLERTGVGDFRIEDSVTLETLEDLSLAEREKLVIPVELALSALPALTVPPFYEKLIKSGCAVDTAKFARALPKEEREYRLYGENGFFAVGKTTLSDGVLLIKHKKLFV